MQIDMVKPMAREELHFEEIYEHREKTREEHLQLLEDAYEQLNYRNMYGLTENSSVPLPYDTHLFKSQEYLKCMMDPIYFAENYYTIVSLDKGQHIIKTYPKQAELINTMINDDRVVVLAARQTGKTTSYCIFATWLMCFNKDKRILIIANKQETALEIMSRIALAFELLPKWLKPSVVEWNKGKIKLSNGCIIQGSSTTADSARSKSCNVLLIDEAAFIPVNIMNKLWESVYPIISSSKNTKCVMVSTPNGTGNLFYDTYNGAVTGKGTDKVRWTDFKIDWWDVPGRDEEWKETQLVSFNYDMKKFNQEFGNQFLGSTYTLVNLEGLPRKRKFLSENPPDTTNLSIHEFKIEMYEKPDRDKCYVIGCDPADGTGNDFSVISIFDITNPTERVAEVCYFSDNKIIPAKLAYLLAKLGLLYNKAPIMVEANNMGNTVVEFLHLIYEYENVASIGHRKLGILSNNKLKIDACQTFRDYFDHPKLNILIRNKQLFTELEYFEKAETGATFTYRATKGRHDDHVMAAVWALYILKQQNVEFFYDAEFTVVGVQQFPIHLNQFDMSFEQEQSQMDEFLNKVYSEIHKTNPETIGEAFEAQESNDRYDADEEITTLGFVVN